ncbi:DNA polymerase III subunit delta' [Hydrogenophaga sp. IBVHS2]|uniref:DNA polymerase III subunit delta' n=1 Tax=Hydrogenophaga sp. IBVHS2 TaxID=1985170 RepID=UPI000A2D41F2|nr:DNA polymerase III subunit delta' [Hydrogenophaga sp. IBVHS2]OSZ68042.1 DNA polymerase III subunit delta' [Hydrogenophaga sp. IBVHS2]
MTAPPALPPWLQRQLEALLAQRGHAILLTGPSGLGQYELGLALVRAWLCERPSPSGACGACGSCHAVDVRTHADLRVLMPETLCLEHGWPLDESTQKDLDEKKRKPSRWIRVDAARDAVGFGQTTRSRGRTKAVLVFPADRLNTESANALLKTLEEPAGDLRFLLATEAADQLLPTVRSRCQTHALAWPDEEEALAWLQAQAGQGGDRSTAQVWWRASGGRPADALAWSTLGLTEAAWRSIPRAVARGDWSVLYDWGPARQLSVLQKLCHDLMTHAAGAPTRYFRPDDLPAPPPWRTLANWSRELSEAVRTVEHPFNAGLMQEAWAARARQVLGKGAVSVAGRTQSFRATV